MSPFALRLPTPPDATAVHRSQCKNDGTYRVIARIQRTCRHDPQRAHQVPDLRTFRRHVRRMRPRFHPSHRLSDPRAVTAPGPQTPTPPGHNSACGPTQQKIRPVTSAHPDGNQRPIKRSKLCIRKCEFIGVTDYWAYTKSIRSQLTSRQPSDLSAAVTSQ